MKATKYRSKPAYNYRQQQFVGVDIAMRHASVVHISQRHQDASSGIAGLFFGKGLFFNDKFEQFSALHQFHHQVTKGTFFVDFVELDDIGTFPRQFEIGNFIFQSISISPVHCGSIDLFDGIFGASRTMRTNKDDRKGTQPQLEKGSDRTSEKVSEWNRYISIQFNP